MNVVGIITARAGSKRLPGKNAMPLGGKPLIAWTVEAAVKSKSLKRVIVSTDDGHLAHLCEKFGAEAPFLRPAALARDGSTHVSVLRHALGWLERHGQAAEYFMILQPTSPFRTRRDIDAACALARQKKAAGVVSVCEVKHHPFWTMTIQRDGSLKKFIRHPRSPASGAPPRVYAPNGAIYLNRTSAFLEETDFYPKKTFAYWMPPERSVDIDTRLDFEWAQFLLKKGRL